MIVVVDHILQRLFQNPAFILNHLTVKTIHKVSVTESLWQRGWVWKHTPPVCFKSGCKKFVGCPLWNRGCGFMVVQMDSSNEMFSHETNDLNIFWNVQITSATSSTPLLSISICTVVGTYVAFCLGNAASGYAMVGLSGSDQRKSFWA